MKLINIIKKNIFFILMIFFLSFMFLFPLPFTIEATGGLISVSDRFSIDGANSNSNYYLAYVSEYKATPITYLYAKLNKDCEIASKSEQVGTDSEANFRNHLMLEEANQDALIYAYSKALKEVLINEEEIYVTYINEDSKTDLQVGDQLIKFNDIEITSKEQLLDLINSTNIGDKIDLEVIYNEKEYTRYAYILDIDGNKKIGFLPTLKRNIEVNPKINFAFDESESGSSGGFMMSLAIYDALTNSNFSANYKIAGTGTIDIDGNIGEIGGIKFKILGAIKEKADIFFVPYENYDEALKTIEDKKSNLKLIKVKHFDEAIEYLNTLKKDT